MNTRQSQGTLIVDVTTNPLVGPVQPLADIPVTIKEILPYGEQNIIAQLFTNLNGQTPLIALQAPPFDLTQSPENFIRPYTPYVVEVNAPGYVPVVINGTQIFADTQSIQPIHLTPLESVSSGNRQDPTPPTQEITIGEPTLYGDYPPKIPEEAIKDTSAQGFIVLDSVVVPEFVVVHAGSPNDPNATNYTVPYKDYIKNVASSEIYPTWPEETIRANVIAITSFTLNRIYTEWYRNQGKPFTITNSTAFDHAFFPDRDIFQSVSVIVDEVFDTYVKRPGVTQPLLTQYCDGVQSSCPGWMTQWGSKDLGDQGKSAEEILKAFYGQEIELIEAPEVSGIPESYPGTPLRLGSEGPDVRTIQEQLNRISVNYPLIPKVRTTGVFDEQTEEAVKTFQRVFYLPDDGVVGKRTWYKISEIFVAVSKIAAL